MQNTSPSEKYAIVAAIGLFFLVLFDNALLMLIVSVLGLAAGLWIARGGTMRRAALVAMVAFAAASVFAVIALLR